MGDFVPIEPVLCKLLYPNFAEFPFYALGRIRGYSEALTELLSLLHLPAQAGRQGVWVDLNLLAQLPALVKQLLPLGQRSPRLLHFLVLPRRQREESPSIFITPNQ